MMPKMSAKIFDLAAERESREVMNEFIERSLRCVDGGSDFLWEQVLEDRSRRRETSNPLSKN